MPFAIEVTARYIYIAPGTGGALLGQQQADHPGYGSTGMGAGPVPAAATASDIVAASVAAGDSAANTDFQTALNNAAAALYTRLITAGYVPGFAGSGTLLAQIQAWPTGGA